MNDMTKPRAAGPEEEHLDRARQNDDSRLAHGRKRAAVRLGVGAAVVLLVMVSWGAWTHIARNASAAAALAARQNAVPLVRTMEAKSEDSPGIVDLPGTVQPFDAATLYARATGYIATRKVDIGSQVHAGDVLAVIAAPDLDQQLAQARAQLGQMVAALQQAQAGKSLAAVTNSRTSRMVVEGWNSRQQGDQDRSNLVTQSAAVRVAEANIAAQQARVNRLVALTGFEQVVAPFDGVISGRQVDVGTLVTADQSIGSPLFSIARTNVLRVQVYVPQEYVFALRDGEGASITIPQLPGRVFHGTVARNAGALATDTRTLLAEVDVDNASHALSPGLYGIVHLEQRSDKPIISVPSEAIIFNANGLNVAVVQNGRVALRHLNVLADDGANVQVQDGVKPGDKVILSPPMNLTGGMRVRTS